MKQQIEHKTCVLDMDTTGNLYLYKTALLCKNEIIKRLINGTYQLAEPASTIGKSKKMSIRSRLGNARIQTENDAPKDTVFFTEYAA